MPTSLTATKIKDTYGQVLHVDGGVTNTPKLVYDGDGTATALKVSTTDVQVNNSPVLTDADIGSTVQAYDADLTAWSGKTAPTGAVVGTTDTQTLTNKTITGSFTGNLTGNADTVTNGVYTVGDQTIGGTKTFSSNPIFNAATANGVAYLNGSKVLTTGSALTFDGTTLANSIPGGVGFRATASSGTSSIRQQFVNTGGTFSIGLDSANGAIFGVAYAGVMWHDGNYPLVFGTNNTEQMRLTSTGLGIGTSTYFDAASKVLTLNGSSSSRLEIGTGGASRGGLYSGGTELNLYTTGAIPLNFGINYSTKMTLDSSGNLGLGVTPSAWDSTLKAIESSNGSAFAANSIVPVTYLGSNYFGSSTGAKYKVNGYASRFVANGYSGGCSFDIAPSGTAGNAISWTQAMTLDASGNLGIGTSSPSHNLTVTANSATSYIVSKAQSGQAAYVTACGNNGTVGTTSLDLIQLSDGSGLLYQRAYQPLIFGTNNAERMRIDSNGNVGIGTSSPQEKLQVNGAILTTGSLSAVRTSAASLDFLSGNTRFISMGADASTKGGFIWYNSTNAAVTESMRLDSSGNVGIGVTPSAWSLGKAIEVGALGTALWTAFADDMYLTSNAYYNSGFKYGNTGSNATAYEQVSGKHLWLTAPSGTAGNAISFTQAMTLDASGNLSLGTTTPAYLSNVASLCQIAVNRIPSTGAIVNTGLSAAYLNLDSASGGSSIQFATAAANNTQPTERMRIDSSGNLLVGTTSKIDGRVSINADTSSSGCIGTSNNGLSEYYPALFYHSGVLRGYISTTGTTTAYVTSSDYRLKENIQPMQNALDVVAQLNPVTYTWKADGSDGQGFIAHELQAVVPDCVTGEKDAVDKDGKPVYQGIDTSFLVATLTKAIQEQQAIINQQAADIAALKAKVGI